MRVEPGVLSDEDCEILSELARRIESHVDEIVNEWTEAWVQAVPIVGADPAAYRQMITYSIGTSLRTTFGYLAAGEFDACFEFQYNSNREYAHSQVPAGAMPLFRQHDMHVVSRLGRPILTRWIVQLFADDRERGLRALLAQERFGGQMAAVLSEAYADEREARLRSVSERLEHALAESEQLRKVGQAIAQSLDLDPVLDLTLQTAIQTVRADGATLTLANREGSMLQLRGVAGGRRSDVGRWIRVADTLHGWAYRHNQPIKGPPFPEAIGDDADWMPPGASALTVPLRVAAQPIGTVAVRNQAGRRFSNHDERVLQSLADAVATAIENARVHAEVRAALADADRANRAKSEFVAAVAHEVRSPLTALVGYIELLRAGAFGDVAEQQREIIERLHVIAQSTVHLTNDLLEHARLEAGMLTVHPETVLLPPVFDELADNARVLLRERPVTLTVQATAGAEQVHADPARLRQILTNLISNAVKFTTRGDITVTATPAKGRRVCISVRDTGSGIHRDDLPHVFDLFYRSESSANVAGAGIGLFVSRQLAQQMDGTLTVESELGRGTTFTLTLPAPS